MSRKRSPSATPTSEASDLEEDYLQPSDLDVLHEEEDRERLLSAPRSAFQTIFARSGSIPNIHSPLRTTRKERRIQKRSEKGAERRRPKDDEASLMFRTGEGSDDSSEYFSSTSSPDRSSEKGRGQARRTHTRRVRLLHWLVIPLVLSAFFAGLVVGAWKVSRKPRLQPLRPPKLLSNGTSNFAPTTILISLDGFRADFLDRGLTPTLNSLIAGGVSPRYMLPSFPSVTSPNHWTLVTGLYPESHGVVGNTFWDAEFQEQFHYTDPARSMQAKWWTAGGVEPIWSTAEGQGVRSAIHMWPGSEAGIQLQPTFLDRYNGTERLARKVDRVLGLLDLPSEHDPQSITFDDPRPQFIAVYVPNVDQDGHLYGPNSTEIRQTIRDVDVMVHNLFQGLEQRNLGSIVNVVVVSDHGMATTSTDRLIQLEDLIDVSDIEHIDGWPLYGLRPKTGVDIQRLYRTLSAASARDPNFDVHLRENMPTRYHFSNNDRIAPLWVIPKTGWAIVHKADFDVKAAKEAGTVYHPRGLHGYDHEHPLMRAIFVAKGPAFPHTPNSRVEVFQNIEVYNIVCDSLGLTPKPNNGTLRLPLKTIGLHSGKPTEELPVDLPASSGGKSVVPSALPTVSQTATATATATTNTTSPSPTPTTTSASDARPTDQAEDEEPAKEHSKGWWGRLLEKAKGAKEWLSGLLKGMRKGKGSDGGQH